MWLFFNRVFNLFGVPLPSLSNDISRNPASASPHEQTYDIPLSGFTQSRRREKIEGHLDLPMRTPLGNGFSQHRHSIDDANTTRPAMKKTAQKTVVQASAVLRQVAESVAAGATMADAIRYASISEKVFLQWRAQYGCFELDQIDRIKDMEAENGMLQRTAYDLNQQMLGLDSDKIRSHHNGQGLIDRLEIADGVVSIDQSDAGMAEGGKKDRAFPQDLVKHLETLKTENHRLRQTVANLTLQKLIRGMAAQE